MLDDALETLYRKALENEQALENLSNQIEAISMVINNKLEALDAAILDISKK